MIGVAVVRMRREGWCCMWRGGEGRIGERYMMDPPYCLLVRASARGFVFTQLGADLRAELV